MPTLVVATTNAGKLRELRTLLAGLGIDAALARRLTPARRRSRDGADLRRQRAHQGARPRRRTLGLPALADDSGLEVDALGGAPGVRSARYAGDARRRDAADADNVALLLERLRDVPEARRTARFRCALVARPARRPRARRRTAAARDDRAAPRGSGGFGYDPVFVDPPSGRTFAELPAEAKDRVSHRAAALAALRPRSAGVPALTPHRVELGAVDPCGGPPAVPRTRSGRAETRDHGAAARQGGIEPPTSSLEGCCSIH